MRARSFAPLLVAAPLLLTAVAQGADPVSFRNDIAPILLDSCMACHGAKKAEGTYRLDTFERAVQPGDSSLAAITPSDLDDSELYRRLVSDDASERMPLDGDPLSKKQIALVKRWIEEGAKYDGPDPKASLAAIVPPPKHAPAPEAYPQTLPITALAFSADGSELYASGYHEVTVWNAADGSLARRITNVGQRTLALALNPDGKLLAAGGGAPGRLGEIRLFDPASGEIVKVLSATTDVVFDLAFSPDGERLAAVGADNLVRIFHVASGELERTIESHSDWVMTVAWSADGKMLATGSRDKTAKVMDAATGETLASFSDHGDTVRGVAFHPEGAEVYSSGADRRIYRWKVADGKKAADVVTFGGEVFRLHVAGDPFFASSADKTARQFELKSHKQVRSLTGHQDEVLAVAAHEKTKRLAAGSFDGQVRIWNLEDGAEVTNFLAAPGYEK